MAQTILIVEDDLPIRESLQLILEADGYAVQSSDHGRHALDRLLAGERPDLILLDHMMPVMSGLEFLDEVLKRPDLAKIPVIVMSALGHLKPPAGIPFLAKPIELEQLLSEIQRRI